MFRLQKSIINSMCILSKKLNKCVHYQVVNIDSNPNLNT